MSEDNLSCVWSSGARNSQHWAFTVPWAEICGANLICLRLRVHFAGVCCPGDRYAETRRLGVSHCAYVQLRRLPWRRVGLRLPVPAYLQLRLYSTGMLALFLVVYISLSAIPGLVPMENAAPRRRLVKQLSRFIVGWQRFRSLSLR